MLSKMVKKIIVFCTNGGYQKLIRSVYFWLPFDIRNFHKPTAKSILRSYLQPPFHQPQFFPLSNLVPFIVKSQPSSIKTKIPSHKFTIYPQSIHTSIHQVFPTKFLPLSLLYPHHIIFHPKFIAFLLYNYWKNKSSSHHSKYCHIVLPENTLQLQIQIFHLNTLNSPLNSLLLQSTLISQFLHWNHS